MVFVAKFSSPLLLKNILEAVSFLIDETYITFTTPGMKMSAIDSSHVAMLLASFPKEVFEEYTGMSEEILRVGINVGDFLKIVKRARSSDELAIKIDPESKNIQLLMTAEGKTRTFKLKSKEIQGYDEKEEGLLESFEQTLGDKFTTTIAIGADIIDEVVKDALIISDLIKVKFNKDQKTLSFFANDESGEFDVEIELSNDNAKCMPEMLKADAEGIYSLNFLESFIKLQSVASTFTMSLGGNIPARIVAKAPADSSVENGPSVLITYLLAPRVEEQGDDFDMDSMDDSEEETSGEEAGEEAASNDEEEE